VGAMLVGGVWALLSILRPLRTAIRGIPAHEDGASGEVPRTERDIPLAVILPGALALAVPLFFVYRAAIDPQSLAASSGVYGGVLVSGLLFALTAGFLFSAVAGYMSGLVGSSNNPISGVTIATVLATSLILLGILGAGDGLDPARASAGASATILVGAVVCCAAAIAGDTMQDLKAGQLVGATPYKQQLMQLVGVLAAALTLAPVLSLLYNAYGLGGMFPREGMDPAQALAAPQATLMQSVALGVFARDLEWGMVAVGAAIAAGVVGLDLALRRRGSRFRTPVLAVAVGIYLPLQLSAAIFAGGTVAYLAGRARRHTGDRGVGRGVLLASGLVAGEAIAGILLAIPFALAQRTDVLRVAPEGFDMGSQALGAAAFVLLGVWLYRVAAARG